MRRRLFDGCRGRVARVMATGFVASLAVVSACGRPDELSDTAAADRRSDAPVEAEADGDRVPMKSSSAPDERNSDLDELAAIDAKLTELDREAASTKADIRHLEQERASLVEEKRELEQENTSLVKRKRDAQEIMRSLEEKARMLRAGTRCLDAWLDRDFDAALPACRAAVGAGDPVAQRTLGHMYRDGQGVTADPREAVSWYRGAAVSGDAGAQFALARSYSEGRGVAKNPEVAVRWLLRAAEQNHNPAQLNLASAYLYGDGVDKSPALAYVWFSVGVESAQEARKPQFAEFRSWAAESMGQHDIAAADEHVRSCLAALTRCDDFVAPPPPARPARGTGSESLARRAGAADLLYVQGLDAYSAGDYVRSRRLFENACADDIHAACVDLGVMYDVGRGGPQDLARAQQLYDQGCSGGDTRGCGRRAGAWRK